MNMKTYSRIVNDIMPGVEADLLDWPSAEAFADDVIGLAAFNWDNELPAGITRDDLVAFFEDAVIDEFSETFSLADNSSRPFEWMIAGVDMSILAEGDDQVIAHVDGHLEVGIAEARDSGRHGFGSLTDAQASDVYRKHSREYGDALTFVRRAVAEWRAEQELDAVLTTSEVAELYNLDDSTPKKAAQEGSIPARKSGGTWLIRREDAEARWGKRK